MAQIALPRPLRNALQSAVLKGREVAEAAAGEALAPYAVGGAKAPEHLDDAGRALRNRLRAHARQLGDTLAVSGKQEIRRLTEEVAYEQWHRILFTRFLVENDLLIHPEFETPVSLAYVEELAKDEERDPWELAAEYASRMLPQIFRLDDPTQEVRLPKNRIQELERLVLGLEREIFKAGDSLGWAYQFWQSRRKEDINASGVKIGKDEVAAVTQLFTEDYMVEFLLHNSLGAWWVANYPDTPLPVEMPYLRFIDVPVEGREGETVREPAAGRFEGWPKSLNDFKALDPCCGSGHFPVFLLHLLVPMRMKLEGLSPAEAVDAVLRQNIHALEIDPRCVEIAVFALALAAWTYPGAGGYRPLPRLNVACCGLPITQKESEWLALANGDSRLREGMRALYGTFKDAPLLGSLVNPRAAGGDLIGAGFDELEPLLSSALRKERIRTSDEATEAMMTASGLLDAARLLDARYHLVITNVPYLARGKQDAALKRFCETHYPDAKADLANVFLERCLELSRTSESREGAGVVQIVMPQNWLFLTSYKKQRESLLKRVQWNLLARLGPGAFETISGEVVRSVLLTQTHSPARQSSQLRGVDASAPKSAPKKAALLREGELLVVNQKRQMQNPDATISFGQVDAAKLFLAVASCYQGTSTGDNPRFVRMFWEVVLGDEYQLFQGPAERTSVYGGRETAVRWPVVKAFGGSAIRGEVAWRRSGVAIGQMNGLPATIYGGQLFSNSTPVVVPHEAANLLPVWAFCSSPHFAEKLRAINQKLSVDNGYVGKIEFDLVHWQEVAATSYPNGLPEPYSDDPTQWIFHGHPCGSVAWDDTNKHLKQGPLRADKSVLHVAVARLLGYRWPAEQDTRMELAVEQREWVSRCASLKKHADDDGIVCIPPVKGERAAADRLLDFLAAAYGDAWTPTLLDKLLADAGYADQSLEDWLRAGFFAQHCKLFHDQPFIWHIWDGERNGFSALVNYHKLDKRLLQTLTFTYLGGWIDEQKRQQAAGADGAKQLVDSAVALQDKLKRILKGERPCDIFVRWKTLAEQPLGWEPDVNDGVRVNIRPFMRVGDVGKKGAGVLRDKPNINWNKDRGNDASSAPWYHLGPAYGENKGARINAHHTTLDEKNKARTDKT